MKTENTRFVMLPETVLYDQRLSPAAKLLYADILALSRESGICRASNGYFCRGFGLSDRQLRRLLEQLQGVGLIQVQLHTDPKNLANSKRLIIPLSAAAPCREAVADKNAGKNVRPNIKTNIIPDMGAGEERPMSGEYGQQPEAAASDGWLAFMHWVSQTEGGAV